MKSIMQHQFSQVPSVKMQRSSFDRSHGHKTTFDAGKLIPIFIDEALPGDTFNLDMTGFARLATPIHPLFDNMYMDTHFFSVPYRLVWDNWKRFNGEQDNPTDSTDFLVPTRTTPFPIQALSDADYLGIPVLPSFSGFSNLPFRAIAKIWNEWFRDQNLQESIEVVTDDTETISTGAVGTRTYSWNATGGSLPRGKRHDYFTSCLPSPQKGPAVELPIGSVAPVTAVTSPTQFDSSGGGSPTNLIASGSTAVNWSNITPAGGMTISNGMLQADLSSATASTINEIRQAFQIQKLFERDARGGTRYNELIKSHFGVTVPDFRVQRPEYLGGGSSTVNITPIAQTSESGVTEQGNLAAMGTATLNNHGFKKSFTEHCIVIGFVSVRADLTYQQGLDRMWSRQTRFDFYQPTLAHLGEQAVLSKEIYADGTANDEDVFGYQERYAEYRYKPSKITGQFRSGHATPLDTWHLSQEFSTRPGLNSTFIEENPPIDRVVAVPSEPHFIFDSYFKLRCSRPMPLYSVPGFVDHF